uniref:Uncharacterized protein n=1 Tax=Meloidogyne incognita TaxID=6306 RepID=A0A914NRX8_MELIC
SFNSFAIVLGDGVCRAVFPPYQSCQSEEKVNIQMLMFTILSNSSYAYMISNEPKKIVQMKLEAKMKVLELSSYAIA